jgi:putative endonuclease
LKTSETGRQGEDAAVRYLIQNAYTIIERNYRVRYGEIDIIAQKDETLVFVEVKHLPHGDVDTLSVLLGKQKQQNIIKTAKCYLQNHRQYSNGYIRFDVLALDVPGLEPVHHIVNAFSE